jgi:serine/threonine-protein kinase
MLGRPLAVGALGMVLLLGLAVVVFYFGVSPRPSDLRKRVADFVNTYDGGHCFFVEPVMVEDSYVDLEGAGPSTSLSEVPPLFDVLDREFARQFGFAAQIYVVSVTTEQCPAVNFLARTKNQPGITPRLDIDTSALRIPGAPLTGSVAEFGDRHVELLLIFDDGCVFNVTEHLRPNGTTKSFSFRPEKSPGPRPQLVFAVASSKPLEALKLPPDGLRAEHVFAQMQAEMLHSGQTAKVGWKGFILD